MKLEQDNQLAYLHSRFERQEGVPGIAHLEDAPKPVLGQVTNLKDLQIWRHGPQVELCDDDVVDDDGRLRRLVQGRRQEVAGALIEPRVRRQRRPVEVEGHGGLAIRSIDASQADVLDSTGPGVAEWKALFIFCCGWSEGWTPVGLLQKSFFFLRRLSGVDMRRIAVGNANGLRVAMQSMRSVGFDLFRFVATESSKVAEDGTDGMTLCGRAMLGSSLVLSEISGPCAAGWVAAVHGWRAGLASLRESDAVLPTSFSR